MPPYITAGYKTDEILAIKVSQGDKVFMQIHAVNNQLAMIKEYPNKVLDFAIHSYEPKMSGKVYTNMFVSQRINDTETVLTNTRLNFTRNGPGPGYSVEEPQVMYPGNCASMLKATRRILIVACPEEGLLEIYLANSLELVANITKYQHFGFSDNI